MTCPVCLDNGWVLSCVSTHDESGALAGEEWVQRECPHLHDPGHAAFNATGVLRVPLGGAA